MVPGLLCVCVWEWEKKIAQNNDMVAGLLCVCVCVCVREREREKERERRGDCAK